MVGAWGNFAGGAASGAGTGAMVGGGNPAHQTLFRPVMIVCICYVCVHEISSKLLAFIRVSSIYRNALTSEG